MTNYERIMHDMTVYKMALKRTYAGLGELGETPHGYWNDAGTFENYEKAIAAELEWLNKDEKAGDDK